MWGKKATKAVGKQTTKETPAAWMARPWRAAATAWPSSWRIWEQNKHTTIKGTWLRGTVTPGTCVHEHLKTHKTKTFLTIGVSVISLRTSLAILGMANHGFNSVHVVHNSRGRAAAIVSTPTTSPRLYMASSHGLHGLRWSRLRSNP